MDDNTTKSNSRATNAVIGSSNSQRPRVYTLPLFKDFERLRAMARIQLGGGMQEKMITVDALIDTGSDW